MAPQIWESYRAPLSIQLVADAQTSSQGGGDGDTGDDGDDKDYGAGDEDEDDDDDGDDDDDDDDWACSWVVMRTFGHGHEIGCCSCQ